MKLDDTERKLAESERARAIEKEYNQAQSIANMSNMMAAIDPTSKTQVNENLDLDEVIKVALLRRASIASNMPNNQTATHASQHT